MILPPGLADPPLVPPDGRRNWGTSGSPDRCPGPDAVRYMSVHSWIQWDSHGLSGTSSG